MKIFEPTPSAKKDKNVSFWQLRICFAHDYETFSCIKSDVVWPALNIQISFWLMFHSSTYSPLLQIRLFIDFIRFELIIFLPCIVASLQMGGNRIDRSRFEYCCTVVEQWRRPAADRVRYNTNMVARDQICREVQESRIFLEFWLECKFKKRRYRIQVEKNLADQVTVCMENIELIRIFNQVFLLGSQTR